MLEALPDRVAACSDDENRHAEDLDDPESDPVGVWGGTLRAPQRKFLRRLAASASYMKNGRINCRESALTLGMRPREIKAKWSEVAEDLGFDSKHLRFWRRRLVEALLGLAADLLRDEAKVTVHGEEARRRPDPIGRLRRVRELRRRIGCRPIPQDVKHVLTRYHRRGSPEGLDPVSILRHAEVLIPDDPAVQLWLFEAHLAALDVAGATRAIRAARVCGAERVPVLLARARLLEFRGKESIARRLLSTRHETERRDDRFAIGAESACRVTEDQRLSTFSSITARSRSARRSPTMFDFVTPLGPSSTKYFSTITSSVPAGPRNTDARR